MNIYLFVANLVLTVVGLGLTAHAGWTGRRTRHFVLAGCTVALLSAAIVQAELFGRDFAFDPVRLRVHLTCAFAALFMLPGVVWSGVGLARARVRRAVHRRWVGAFVALTVAAMATAGWMFFNADPN
ncbi:MAG TPA: hypothetical protein VGC54_11875 [Planctomycetota bacterium]